MSGDVLVKTFERRDGGRVALRWRTDGQRHWLEVAREQRAGDGWRQLARVAFFPSEVFELADAVELVTKLAMAVRR